MALCFGLAAGNGGVAVNHAIASLVVGVFTGGLVLGAMPLVENAFKVATDATLFELTDFNHPLLRRMQVEAPGTYHHSLMVANLSENAALAVKANPILCRACSLFHDIGKMSQPDYFTENQGGFENPHSRQNPAMGLIIKSHVKEGLEMAREHRLPKVIRDVFASIMERLWSSISTIRPSSGLNRKSFLTANRRANLMNRPTGMTGPNPGLRRAR